MTEQFDEQLKQIKGAMPAADCDMSVVRAWLKLYDRVKKQTEETKESYKEARKKLEEMQSFVSRIEYEVIEDEWGCERQKEEIGSLTEKMAKLDGTFTHEFLVNSDNQEYLLSYRSVIELSKTDCDKIIYQSEVENLSAMNQEILERKTPNFYHLGFYETNRSAEDLSDLPYSEKMRKIGSLYEADFIRPIEKQLVLLIEYADRMKQAQTGLGSLFKRRKNKLPDFLFNADGETKNARERAAALIEPLREGE